MLRIKLLPSTTQETAHQILKGHLPPETSDLEVIRYLTDYCAGMNIPIKFVRGADVYSLDEMQHLFSVEGNDPRPEG
jgi:hypothetical protein